MTKALGKGLDDMGAGGKDAVERVEITEVPKVWHDYNNFKCHLISIVSDYDRRIVVYKYWNRGKRRWQYLAETERMVLFGLNYARRYFRYGVDE